MSRTFQLPPRVAGDDEIEQLKDDLPDAESDLDHSGSPSGGYFNPYSHGRKPSQGTSMSRNSSSGDLTGSYSQPHLSSSGHESPHGMRHSRSGSYETFMANTANFATSSAQSHTSVMTPAAGLYDASTNTSLAHVALKYRKPFAQRVLREDETPEKPWLETKRRKTHSRRSYWIFIFGLSFGLAGAALLMYFAYAAVPKGKYCLVLDEQFEGTTINKDIWFHEQETGGFGNNQFDWTTDSANNSFVQDGKLYIVPTLTSDALGEGAITNGYTLNLTESNLCTASNKTDASCAVRSNSTTGVVLPPIQSARLMTNFSRSIKYGKVEVKARMPTGDWIWPAIWMMPKDSVYGSWPRSGEIDIFEGRGNVPTKRKDLGTNVMSSSLHFGPNSLFDGYGYATKMRDLWRNWFNQGSHTFGLEWTEDALWTWEHSPIFRNLDVKFGDGFWKRGQFPSQMANGTLLSNPWANVQGEHSNAAPFDQEFYLILNVAVGGTNGYFKDGQGDDKPWSNDAENAAGQFWQSKDKWLPTWPTDPKQRGMEIEYVKMWQKC
ncbi:Glycoside hydrolase, family 16 [Kalmanozyma brasiliensis GHG001]|uniref:GH16 domain-containing protein n=1 Tax=Kalmanozyma brasiliensis (strain GHG001) TaxID=1365824 RepID=V5GLT0_KALBG|nr:Glycoside hydrolase, family 16 [Kalmanozyma brasiliensis GHG001]EST06922.1 Glycoside hydrolase, family 16 [Kalmanozyma brasiliensis GHG001]